MEKSANRAGILTRLLAFTAGIFVLIVMGAGLSGCAEKGGATAEALLDSESSAVTASGSAVDMSGQNALEEMQSGSDQSSGMVDAQEAVQAPDTLEVHFLDVGQGDSTLIICGDEAMLIDAGDNDQGTKIQNYLRNQGVESLKYVICTHPDEDHIGGMDVILYKFDCETILMTDEEKDTNTYRDVVDTMENRGYQRTLPVTGQQYSLGDAMFTVVGPVSMSSDSNNNSIAILLEHGTQKFLFTGDAEEDEEAEILAEAAAAGISLDVDVYKAGHHGSRTSSSEALLDAVSPTYIVISCGEGNSYGHPNAETLNHFRARGISIFRTDEQGSVMLVSDGEHVTWNCSPSDTWQAGEPAGASGEREEVSSQEPAAGELAGASGGKEEVQVPQTVDYICNTNTKKFHYPDCGSVKQMSEKNKLPVNTTREELIQQGYVPCKNCNP
ncbi:MAG: MBL fold metallo-hydrolase [Lachnospiraceae bacterium]|nr:MBL fold metallo-hydrolase [Lachnospiraceae bacterium]